MRIAGSVTLMVTFAFVLGGCASVMNRPPSCDGFSRRPLNRSMWDWEAGRRVTAPTNSPKVSEATAPAKVSRAGAPPSAQRVAALPEADLAAANRSCS